MVDVFISYSRADKAAVSHLAHRIEAEGYDVWWDEELPPHKSYGDVISAKIAEAKTAIVVWSPDAAASEWVRAEADMARNQKKLIQTALGDIMPPLPFNQIQFADIGDWQGEDDHSGWRKVKASLADLCGEREGNVGAGAGAAAAVPPPLPRIEPTQATVNSAASKWPLFVGIGIALLAIVGSAAFFMGSMGGGGKSNGDERPSPQPTDTEAPDPVLAPEPSPQAAPSPIPQPTASTPPSASRGRIVGCYFWNSVDTYDGACRFVAGSDGDFTTFAMDGPYFDNVVRIDLDVSAPGTGNIEFYLPDGSVNRVKVRRSANDRACWDGPNLTFCAR